jgi:hypothetical protein
MLAALLGIEQQIKASIKRKDLERMASEMNDENKPDEMVHSGR